MMATLPAAPSQDIEHRAFKWGAHAIMVAHNHPSGNLEPSKADLDFTRRLVQLGEISQIQLLDHLIISPNHTTSKSYNSIRGIEPEVFKSTGVIR